MIGIKRLLPPSSALHNFGPRRLPTFHLPSNPHSSWSHNMTGVLTKLEQEFFDSPVQNRTVRFEGPGVRIRGTVIAKQVRRGASPGTAEHCTDVQIFGVTVIGDIDLTSAGSDREPIPNRESAVVSTLNLGLRSFSRTIERHECARLAGIPANLQSFSGEILYRRLFGGPDRDRTDDLFHAMENVKT
jgi:hypothetical protein